MLAHKRSAQIGIFSASSSSRRYELIFAPIRRSGRMAVRPNVTFCVISPALADACRSPLWTGARTRTLGQRGGPDVRVMDCALLPGCRVSARARELWPEDQVMMPKSGQLCRCPHDEPFSDIRTDLLLQDRLPKSDTVAPKIGQYGPAQANMIASQGADLRVCVELRGFEPLTPSMRTQRASGQTAQVTAFAQVSGLHRVTITASEAA
jgi:hypothetical protein